MKKQKELKIIRVSEDVCVACGRIFDKYGVGTFLLDTKDMSRREIERVFTNRCVTQVCRLRTMGRPIPNMVRGGRWEVKWYDYSNVANNETAELPLASEPSVSESVAPQKPKIYYIAKRPDGGFETKKIESKLYDEDEINAMFGNL